MNYRIQAVYDHGAFIPKGPCDLPEKTEVELFIQLPSLVPASIRDLDEKARVLKRVVERMRRHSVPADAPRFTREELHERR